MEHQLQDPADSPPWQIVRFDEQVPATEFSTRMWDGLVAVEANADQSMALLARPLSIALQETPVLCWRWRIETTLEKADMTKKEGDDYAARVYLTFELPAETLSFGTRMKLKLAKAVYGNQVPDAALNYIWDNQYPVGTEQANTYTDRAWMLVLRSGGADAKRWVEERRNIVEDMQRSFGVNSFSISSIAIASDTDNTGEKTSAGFADLHFVPANEACQFTEKMR